MAQEALSALTRSYPAGTVLFEENDPGSRMYVIRSGKVRIFRRLAGSEIVLAFLGPGDFFGEMALLEGLPRSATAEVVEPSEIIEVDAGTFDDMVRGSSEIAARIMRKLAARLREADKRIENLLIESAVGRAVEVLRWLHGQGQPEGNMVRVRGGVSQIDLAAQAGIPAQQANSVLLQLERARCIRFDGEDLLIASPKVLDEYQSYLDLKRKYDDPSTPLLPSETHAARSEERLRAMQRLLVALQLSPADLEARQSALAAQYRRYVELQARFRQKQDNEG